MPFYDEPREEFRRLERDNEKLRVESERLCFENEKLQRLGARA